jgi:hypothetical protein
MVMMTINRYILTNNCKQSTPLTPHQHHFGAEWNPPPPLKPVSKSSRYHRRKTRGWTLEDKAAAMVQVLAAFYFNHMSMDV